MDFVAKYRDVISETSSVDDEEYLALMKSEGINPNSLQCQNLGAKPKMVEDELVTSIKKATEIKKSVANKESVNYKTVSNYYGNGSVKPSSYKPAGMDMHLVGKEDIKKITMTEEFKECEREFDCECAQIAEKELLGKKCMISKQFSALFEELSKECKANNGIATHITQVILILILIFRF